VWYLPAYLHLRIRIILASCGHWLERSTSGHWIPIATTRIMSCTTFWGKKPPDSVLYVYYLPWIPARLLLLINSRFESPQQISVPRTSFSVQFQVHACISGIITRYRRDRTTTCFDDQMPWPFLAVSNGIIGHQSRVLPISSYLYVRGLELCDGISVLHQSRLESLTNSIANHVVLNFTEASCLSTKSERLFVSEYYTLISIQY
jgi:hypothetical protein